MGSLFSQVHVARGARDRQGLLEAEWHRSQAMGSSKRQEQLQQPRRKQRLWYWTVHRDAQWEKKERALNAHGTGSRSLCPPPGPGSMGKSSPLQRVLAGRRPQGSEETPLGCPCQSCQRKPSAQEPSHSLFPSESSCGRESLCLQPLHPQKQLSRLSNSLKAPSTMPGTQQARSKCLLHHHFFLPAHLGMLQRKQAEYA